jgi:hypothetical protein
MKVIWLYMYIDVLGLFGWMMVFEAHLFWREGDKSTVQPNRQQIECVIVNKHKWGYLSVIDQRHRNKQSIL